MKRIQFTRTELYESGGRGKGPTFKEGSIHEFEDNFADRWLRRGVAIELGDGVEVAPALLDPIEPDESEIGPASDEEIRAALAVLDHANAEHWTQGGLPKVEAVAELTGKTVTRAQIDVAAPDAKRLAPA